jgi:hypothetical protein
MGAVGRILRRVRAGEHRSPLAGAGFVAPYDITITSTTFDDGGAMPVASAGKGVGDNASPQLHWTGQPAQTRQVVLIIDDVDVPLPRPLLHTVTVVDPNVHDLGAGALQPGTDGLRFIRGSLGHQGMLARARFPVTGRTATGSTCSRSTSRFPVMSPAPKRC